VTQEPRAGDLEAQQPPAAIAARLERRQRDWQIVCMFVSTIAADSTR
jgi:hypothetical protein